MSALAVTPPSQRAVDLQTPLDVLRHFSMVDATPANLTVPVQLPDGTQAFQMRADHMVRVPQTALLAALALLEHALPAAEQRAATAEHRLYSYRQHNSARSKTLAEFIKQRAPELWPDYAAVGVNGSMYSQEYTLQPVYEREMNTLRYRAEAAEERAVKAEAELQNLKQEQPASA